MASVNVKKCHGSEAAHILAHNYRHHGKDVQYRNEHIDTARSKDNDTLMFNRFGTAHSDYERLKRRVEEIDKAEPPKRIRKDRVTEVAFYVPAPDGLPSEKEPAFFRLAYEEIAKMCGGPDNVSRMKIHRDEVHEYTDPLTKERKTSRVHAHVIGIPYVKGKGVNCKTFMSRQALRDLQKRVDDRCRSEIGVNFMDGSRQKSRGTVEDLKRASARTEQELAERIAAQEAILADLRSQTAVARAEAKEAAKEAARARTEALEQREAAEAFRAEAGEAYEDLHRIGTIGFMVDYIERYHEREFELWAMDRARTREDIETAKRSLREQWDDLER